MEIIRSFWTALKAAVSPLTAFLTGTTLVCCGYASLNSTFALQLNLSDTPMFVSGLVLACYYLGSITASLSAYKFINKVGNIRAFSAFTSLLSALVLLHVFTGNLFLWPFLRSAKDTASAPSTCVWKVGLIRGQPTKTAD